MAEEDALPLRTEAVKDSFTIRGMFLTNLVNLVKQHRGDDVANRVMASAKLSATTFGLATKYPLLEFMRLLHESVKELKGPLGSAEAAVSREGSSTVEIFFQSMAGRTMKLLAGRDPHRLVSAAVNGYGLAVTDDTVRRYERTGDNSCDFFFQNDVLGPCHNHGVFLAAIRDVHGLEPTIEIEQSALLDYVFHVRW